MLILDILYNQCLQRDIICCFGPSEYDALLLDKRNIRNGQLILLADLQETVAEDETTVRGTIALLRKSEETTHSNLDESFQEKYERRLVELEQFLKALFQELECSADITFQSVTYTHLLNQYDLNADGVSATVSMLMPDGFEDYQLPPSELEVRVYELETRVEKLEDCCDELHSVVSINTDPNTIAVNGKLLKKREDRDVYDEIKSVDISSSYNSGQQIATVVIDGKTKPLYIRESIFLDGVFSPARQLWFRMDEQNGKLFVSFDKGQTYKTVVLQD